MEEDTFVRKSWVPFKVVKQITSPCPVALHTVDSSGVSDTEVLNVAVGYGVAM